MDSRDPQTIANAFAEQGWNKPSLQFENYLAEQAEGKREALVAEVDGEFAGYVTLLWTSKYPPFADEDIPEISDLNVLTKFQRRGIASKLLDAAEKATAEQSSLVGIAVGLTADYGPAQRLYISRGYVPDGSGLAQNGKQLNFGDEITIDDEMNLYLIKQLT